MIKKMMYMIFFSFVSSQIENISVDDIINKMDKNSKILTLNMGD